MDDIIFFLELPITTKVAAVSFVVCATWLFVALLATPQRECFFFRWPPEIRLLALLVSPALLIFWPVVVFWLFLESRGITSDDLDDFMDD